MLHARGQQWGDHRVEVSSALVNLTYRSQKFFTHCTLQNVTTSSGLQGPEDFLLPRVSGEHQDTSFWKLVHHCSCGFHSADPRKSNIHDDQIGQMPAVGLERQFTIGRLGYHLHVRFYVQGGGQSHADHEMVIHD